RPDPPGFRRRRPGHHHESAYRVELGGKHSDLRRPGQQLQAQLPEQMRRAGAGAGRGVFPARLRPRPEAGGAMSGDAARLQRYRERLAGALRALAGAPQLAVSFDGAPAHLDADGAHLPPLQQPPAEWTSWRALADRLALRFRHPLPLSRPLPDRLAPLVEALWQARLEAIGAREWPGVAANLQASLLESGRAAASRPAAASLPERLRLIAHHRLGV